MRKRHDDIVSEYRYNPSDDLRDRIYNKYEYLAIRSAKSLSRLYRHISLDELLQHARIGLWKAIERYDPSKGVPFNTYAVITCKNTIKEELRKEDPIPRRIRDKKKKIENIINTEKNTAIEEIMLETGLTHKQYVSAVIQYQASQQKSIDEEHNDKIKSKTDIELDFLNKQQQAELEKALKMLTNKEQMLIQSLFVKGNTKARTASIFVTSLKGIRYEERKAIEKLYYAIHIIRNNYNFNNFILEAKPYKFSIDEIAEKTGVHRTTIYDWKSGQAPSKKNAERLLSVIARMAKPKK
jgi:RNA polymerase sigma factor for flagellar operon FliA